MIEENPEAMEKAGVVPAGWPTVLVPSGGRSVATAERRGGTYYHGDRKTQVDLGGLVKVVAPAGWPTPVGGTPNSLRGTGTDPEIRKAGGHQVGLQDAVRLAPAGWSTPTAMDGRRGNAPEREHDKGTPLSQQVAGWPTVQARDWKDGVFSADGKTPANSMLGRTACLSRAETDDGGALNPEFACWLMGFPQAFVWACSVGWAMRSSRKSRRSSSKASSRSSE